jgi:uncharacterized membrane protein SpoIIM required for sporulation
MAIIAGIAVAGYWASYAWTVTYIPKLLPRISSADIGQLAQQASESIGLARIREGPSAGHILANNLRATFLLYLAGIVSFGVLGLTAYLINIGLVGAVLGAFRLMGLSPSLYFAAGLLPHGMFEIPALMFVSAAVLHMGAAIVAPQTGKSMGQAILELLADSAKVFLGVVSPLLVLAALTEAYITPAILAAAVR